MTGFAKYSEAQIAEASRYASLPRPEVVDPRIDALVTNLIGRVADRWTLLILDVLTENGTMRFSRLADAVAGISQKMLTQILRAMERDGLVSRTVYHVVPPKMEYRLTNLGLGLSAAFCGVWIWAADNLAGVEAARSIFDRARDG